MNLSVDSDGLRSHASLAWRPRSAITRSAGVFAGGLTLLFAFTFVALMFVAAIIRLVSVTATSDAGGAAHLGLPLRVWVPALTLAAIAFVFAAGLIDLLVRRADDPAAGLETALRAFRRSHWLLLAGLAATPLVVIVAQATSYLILPWLVVLAVADVLLVFGLYTVPLILDRRLDTVRALAESVHLARLGSFTRPFAVLAGLTLTTAGFWYAVWTRVAALGQYEYQGSGVHVGDAATWPLRSLAEGRTFLGLTSGDLRVSLTESAALTITCATWAVIVAVLYVRARRSATGAPAPPQMASRSHTRTRAALAAVITAVAALAGAALFLSWYGAPLGERPLWPGHTVTLRNGLTLTVPPGAHAGFFPTRRYPSWLGLGDNGGQAVAFVQGPLADAVAWDAGAMLVGSYSPGATPPEMSNALWRSPLISSAADGAGQVYWRSGSRFGFIVTHLPGHLTGFIRVRLDRSWRYQPVGPAQAMEGLADAWRVSSLRGMRLPAQTAWRSQTVARGQRVTLACGLSLVMPHRWPAELASTKLSDEAAQMFMPLTLHSKGWYGEVLSLRGESDTRLLAATDRAETRLVARSVGGAIEIYGPKPDDPAQVDGTQTAPPHDEWVSIVVHLPGHAIGLLSASTRTTGALSRRETWRCAARFWTAYHIEGAPLPRL